MRHIIVCILFLACCLVQTEPVDCVCNEKNLYGKVKVVDYKADFNIKIVDFGQYLDVQRVDNKADECGEWQFVDFGEDFTVRFVDFGEDFSIKYVDYKPGVH